MQAWLGIAANGSVAGAYFVISAIIFRGLWRQMDQVGRGRGPLSIARFNPLGLATGLIFFTCAVGHANHAVHAVMGVMGMGGADMAAAAAHLGTPTIWAVDSITVVAAIYYLILRKRLPALFKGASMFEDMLRRRKHALDINDHIAQGLVATKMALEIDDRDLALAHARETLESSQRIMADLLGSDLSEATLEGGRLRRSPS